MSLVPLRIQRPDMPTPFWRLFMGQFLGASPRLSRALWRRFVAWAPYDVLDAVIRCDTRPASDSSPVAALCQALRPQRLLGWLEEMAPANGQVRDREVRRVEQAILEKTGPEGDWL